MLHGLAALGLLAASELDRDRLIDNLGYGVSVTFEVRMTVEELEGVPRGVWLEELIARYAGESDHPVAHLARARSALAQDRTSEFREEIDAAGRGLHDLWQAEGDAFGADLRFLLGYCYGAIYKDGGPSAPRSRDGPRPGRRPGGRPPAPGAGAGALDQAFRGPPGLDREGLRGPGGLGDEALARFSPACAAGAP